MKYPDLDHFIREGRVWRAKEILQGQLSSAEFDPELLKRYGEVLLHMADKIEAGRYLFCSGVRSPGYEEAIGLFLERNSRKWPEQFLSTLPAMVRRHADLQNVLSSDFFEKFGYTKQQIESLSSKNKAIKSNYTPKHWYIRYFENAKLAIVIGFIVVSFLVGALSIARFTFEIVFGKRGDCAVVDMSACTISPSHSARKGK